jgi:outer membrane protein assembly factor BamB
MKLTCLTSALLLIGSVNCYSVSSCLSDPAWPFSGHDVVNTNHNSSENNIKADTVKKLKFNWVAPGIAVLHTPVISSDGHLYYVDNSGKLYSRVAKTGDLVWSTQVGPAGLIAGREGSPLIVGDVLYLGEYEGTVLAVNRLTGAIIWTKQLSAQPKTSFQASPTYADGKVFFADESGQVLDNPPYTYRGSVYALDAATGNLLWQFTPNGNPALGAGNGFRASPVLDTERKILYIGSGNAYEPPAGNLTNALLAINYVTGQLLWSYQFTPGQEFSKAFPNGRNSDLSSANLFSIKRDGQIVDVVGVGDQGGSYKVFDRVTGNLIWGQRVIPENHLGSTVGGYPSTVVKFDDIGNCKALAKKLIVVASYDNEDGTIFDGATLIAANSGDLAAIIKGTLAITKLLKIQVSALDADTGQILWEKHFDGAASGALTSSNDVVFQSGYSGVLRALDTHNGKVKWKYKNPKVDIFGVISRLTTNAPAISTLGEGDSSAIYFGSGIQNLSGGLYSFKIKS